MAAGERPESARAITTTSASASSQPWSDVRSFSHRSEPSANSEHPVSSTSPLRIGHSALAVEPLTSSSGEARSVALGR
jgi:hypothetical protein